MIINLKESFTFMFKDKKFWSKYAIGVFFAIFFLPSALLSLSIYRTPILPFIVAYLSYIAAYLVISGYTATYTNSNIVQHKEDLPEWHNNLFNILKVGVRKILGIVLFLIAEMVVMFPIVILIMTCITVFILLTNPVVSSIPQYLAQLTALPAMIMMYVSAFLMWFFLLIADTSFVVDLKIFSFFNLKRAFKLLNKNFLNMILLFGLLVIYLIILNISSFVLWKNNLPYIYTILSLLLSFYFNLVFANILAQYVKIGMQNNIGKVEETKVEPIEEATNNTETQE